MPDIVISRDIFSDNNAVASIVGGIMSHDMVKVTRTIENDVDSSGLSRLFPNKNQRIISSFSTVYPVLGYPFPSPVRLSQKKTLLFNC